MKKRNEIVACYAIAATVTAVTACIGYLVFLAPVGKVKTPVTVTPSIQPIPTRIVSTITQTVLTSIETITPEPTETAPCIWAAEYITDVTVPDGAFVEPGQIFTKTWAVLNTGTCTWESVRLVFAGWTQMTDVQSVAVDETKPGDSVNVSVAMTAPSQPERYIGAWAVCLNGECFCQLIVDVVVKDGR